MKISPSSSTVPVWSTNGQQRLRLPSFWHSDIRFYYDLRALSMSTKQASDRWHPGFINFKQQPSLSAMVASATHIYHDDNDLAQSSSLVSPLESQLTLPPMVQAANIIIYDVTGFSNAMTQYPWNYLCPNSMVQLVDGWLSKFVTSWHLIGVEIKWVINVFTEWIHDSIETTTSIVHNWPSGICNLSRIHKGSCSYHEVLGLINTPANELVPNSIGFFNHLFVALKHAGAWRPVSTINSYAVWNPFKMDIPRSILAKTRPGQWMTLVDVTIGYFHIPPYTCWCVSHRRQTQRHRFRSFG